MSASGVCFGYASSVTFWIHVDATIYHTIMLSGGFFGSVIAWINFGTRYQNCITVSIGLLQFLSWTLTCVIVDPSENPLVYPGCFVSGLASGILYTALPHVFRHCPLSVSRLYFNIILPAAFCAGLCFINKCIMFIGIFNSILVQLVILTVYWTIMLFRSYDTIWNKDPRMNSDEEYNVERDPSIPCLQKKDCSTESTILEDFVVADSDKFSDISWCFLLWFQPLSGTLCLPFFQLICMNMANDPVNCYSVYVCLHLMSTLIGCLLLSSYSYTLLLPVTSFALVPLYYAVYVYQPVHNTTTGLYNDTPLYLIMMMITMVSSLGWVQVPYSALLRFCCQKTRGSPVTFYMTVWWFSGFFSSLTFHILSVTIKFDKILLTMAALSGLLTLSTSIWAIIHK
ncbi:hypothetical protein D915_004544 [Fasciola hepatica]|uniref:Transmembrane protein n=1 Tax=Fasciola hepatica TaxID=6192 RepID=A0A4E0R7P5_FASHE|nr:hypothetical protein D915_004544 [Fasciola hepatica]